MIKKDNFKDLVIKLGYEESAKNVYCLQLNQADSIIVNFEKEEITWPVNLTVNDRTTSNFDHPENFVVFECMSRLLKKGYYAKNMELEPRWQLGRGASGGKADILIRDNNNHEFLIIECKTYGEEFNKAWQKTKIDGDQLFSYAQQIKRTQYLCLYASNFENNEIVYNYRIMTLKDNEEYLKTLKPSNRLRYKDASNVKELYKVWKEIYNLEYEDTGIFEECVVPYEINKVYSINDLKSVSFDDTQKKYNEFATILRQHNVSGHENAFDKLINIFLAKIVDEIQHSNSLEFNWKGIAFDDYYQLQDRLQKLYKDGMQKFLNEKVTYIDNKQINNAFKLFKNDPDATKDTIMNYFRELKFYTNNDFAFIDVHNEELFKQNSEILLKIVKMFQDIKLKTEHQNQFLGDLFEGFLDDGVKQSEGQFFTPLPITRFIVSSLPLKEIIEQNDSYPKVIDYACGAGHFLNEYASQIKKYFTTEEELQNCYSEIDGIEKEYRLSKVSKVSAFMYGQDNINITYGDALADNENIKDEAYDILIANPPYSVKGFLETLTEEERKKYELTKLVNKNTYSTNNSIETFFVEKAKKLLKPGGVSAIILPASILTNGNNLYTRTREIILQNFDILSIVELPSGTFSATGTNTITLFLRKKEENPALADHFKNRVNSWFNGNFNKDKVFEDNNILEAYLEMQGIELNDYLNLIKNKVINRNLKEHNLIKEYLSDSKVRNIDKILEIEKDKLYHFMLAFSQKNDVLVVNAPSNKEEVKKFLGYEWSNRKGSEGIKYLGANINDINNALSKNKGIEKIITPLFNPLNLDDKKKVNSIIRNNYLGNELEYDYENIKQFNLIELLNFKKTSFDKSISLYKETNIEIKSKYNTDLLGNVCNVLIGGTPARAIPEYFQGKNLWVSVKEMNGQIIKDTNEKITDEAIKKSNVKLIPAGTTLLSFKLSIGKTAIAGKDLYTNEAIAGLIPKNEKLLNKYLFYLFNTNVLNIDNISKKAFGKSLNSNFLKNNISIPIPPIEIQKKIILECEKIDEEYSKTETSIEKCKEKIERVFVKGEQSSNTITVKLSDTNRFKLSIGNRVLKKELSNTGNIPVISANVNEEFGKINKEIIDDYSLPYILWGIDGDWMVNYLDKGIKFYPTDHCGYLKVMDENINPLFLAKIIEIEGNKQKFSRSNRASIERVSSIIINLPSIKVQNKIAESIKSLNSYVNEMKSKLHQLDSSKRQVIDKYIK